MEEFNNKIFNIIDLDSINQEIRDDPELDRLYNQFMKLKNDKNDKWKEVDKKMSGFWEQQFINLVEKKIIQKRVNIFIGMNNNYKGLAKRVPIECTNKFIIKVDPKKEVEQIIRYNLDTHKNDIIGGNFPLEYINHDYLLKKRINIETTYKKLGYIEKTKDEIKDILSMVEKAEKKDSMWVAMKEPYNVGSLIHPKENTGKIIGFTDSNMALLGSINFVGDEVRINKGAETINIKEVKSKGLNKMKTKRFLYLVETNSFMPDTHEHKFFSQLPVRILAKEKVDSVYDHFMK
jgi:hypothetical protein